MVRPGQNRIRPQMVTCHPAVASPHQQIPVRSPQSANRAQGATCSSTGSLHSFSSVVQELLCIASCRQLLSSLSRPIQSYLSLVTRALCRWCTRETDPCILSSKGPMLVVHSKDPVAGLSGHKLTTEPVPSQHPVPLNRQRSTTGTGAKKGSSSAVTCTSVT